MRTLSTRFENTALALAGFSLLVVTFTGLSLFRGRTAGEPKPLDSRRVTPWDEFAGLERSTSNRAGLGLMDAWRIPSPFSAEELTELVDELARETERVNARGAELDAREARLERRNEALDAREAEVARAEAAERTAQPDVAQRTESRPTNEHASARWTEVAKLFASIPVDQAKVLLGTYEPEDAAAILHTIGDELVEAELLAALRTASTLRAWKAYVDAYSVLTGDSAD